MPGISLGTVVGVIMAPGLLETVVAFNDPMSQESLKSHLQAVWEKFSNKLSNSIHEKSTVKAPSMIEITIFGKESKMSKGKEQGINDEQIEQLIEEVRANPCIWDKSCRQHKNKELRNKAWFKISLIIGVSVDTAQSKWEYLQDLTGKIARQKIPSRSGASSVVKWRYWASMSFLVQADKPRNTSMNFKRIDIDHGIIDAEDEQESLDDSSTCSDFKKPTPLLPDDNSTNRSFIKWPPLPSQYCSSYSKSKATCPSACKRTADDDIKSLLAKRLMSTPKPAADDMFGKLIAARIAEYPSDTKNRVMIKIMQILEEADLEKMYKLNYSDVIQMSKNVCESVTSEFSLFDEEGPH